MDVDYLICEIKKMLKWIIIIFNIMFFYGCNGGGMKNCC